MAVRWFLLKIYFVSDKIVQSKPSFFECVCRAKYTCITDVHCVSCTKSVAEQHERFYSLMFSERSHCHMPINIKAIHWWPNFVEYEVYIHFCYSLGEKLPNRLQHPGKTCYNVNQHVVGS